MTNIEPTESQQLSVNKQKLAETAAEMEKAAVTAAIAGQEEAIIGAKRIQAAGDMAHDSSVMIARGASDVTQAMDAQIMSERMAILSDAVGVAGVVDIAEGAEILAQSNDVGVLSALVGMMSEDDLEHGLELARLSGELQTAGELVEDLRMPVLAAFLTDRAARLHEMSLEQIRVAISTEGVSQLLAGAGSKIGELGENEVAEGVTRLVIADAAAVESAAMADASVKLAEQGIEEMIVGGELAQVARIEAAEGSAELSAGSAVVGAAMAIDNVANTLKEKSEE